MEAPKIEFDVRIDYSTASLSSATTSYRVKAPTISDALYEAAGRFKRDGRRKTAKAHRMHAVPVEAL